MHFDINISYKLSMSHNLCLKYHSMICVLSTWFTVKNCKSGPKPQKIKAKETFFRYGLSIC